MWRFTLLSTATALSLIPLASVDFIALLGKLDAEYPALARIRLLLDNHSAHIPKRRKRTLVFTRSGSSEPIDRIYLYFAELNADPGIFRWKDKLNEAASV